MDNMYGIIESLCASKGIKPGKLCSELGISRGTIGDLKAGRTKKLSAENVAKIASYFGVSTDYLLGKTSSRIIDLFSGAKGYCAEEENKKTPAESGKRSGSHDILDDVDIAFYGDYKELTEDDKATVRDMVRIMRERRSKKQEQ